jgi:hypothetical protein
VASCPLWHRAALRRASAWPSDQRPEAPDRRIRRPRIPRPTAYWLTSMSSTRTSAAAGTSVDIASSSRISAAAGDRNRRAYVASMRSFPPGLCANCCAQATPKVLVAERHRVSFSFQPIERNDNEFSSNCQQVFFPACLRFGSIIDDALPARYIDPRLRGLEGRWHGRLLPCTHPTDSRRYCCPGQVIATIACVYRRYPLSLVW